LSTLIPVLERLQGFQRLTGVVDADGETSVPFKGIKPP